jgi:hypothetical protein
MNPSIIYKQFHIYVPLDKMTGLQWFSLLPNYGESYGNIHTKYRFIKQPKLLDIGNGDIRTMIRETIKPFDSSIDLLSDPDEQYSGTSSNKKYHALVQQYFGDEYDGTIIDEHNLRGNKDYLADDLAGPSEVVLWKNYDKLLEVQLLEKGGAKIPRKNTRKKGRKKQIRRAKKSRKNQKKSKKTRNKIL